jgi:hypothetical protein
MLVASTPVQDVYSTDTQVVPVLNDAQWILCMPMLVVGSMTVVSLPAGSLPCAGRKLTLFAH